MERCGLGAYACVIVRVRCELEVVVMELLVFGLGTRHGRVKLSSQAWLPSHLHTFRTYSLRRNGSTVSPFSILQRYISEYTVVV